MKDGITYLYNRKKIDHDKLLKYQFRRMKKSLLKSESNNNTSDVTVSVTGPDQAPASAPVSVVVDVVNHDEPSVSSVMSNGAAASLHDNVSIARTVIFPH